jgi:hypothetical protein
MLNWYYRLKFRLNLWWYGPEWFTKQLEKPLRQNYFPKEVMEEIFQPIEDTNE